MDSMSFWIATACQTLRKQAGFKQTDVAAVCHRDQSAIHRFEAGDRRWPRDLDLYVAGYARCAGLADGRTLWRIALELWMQAGSAPQVPEPEVRDPGDLERLVIESVLENARRNENERP